jgi:hypothetical protein
VVLEIVQRALGEPDSSTCAGYDGGRLRSTAHRENTSCWGLRVLRHLESQLGEELIAVHRELGIGAERYPNGLEEGEEERRRRVEGGESCGAVS